MIDRRFVPVAAATALDLLRLTTDASALRMRERLLDLPGGGLLVRVKLHAVEVLSSLPRRLRRRDRDGLQGGTMSVVKKARSRAKLEPVPLPHAHCTNCGYDHPARLNSRHAAAYLHVAVSTLYSMKSRKQLPPTLPGRKTPLWDGCALALLLHQGVLLDRATL